MKRALIVLLGIAFVVALATSARAIPSLGVIDSDLLASYDGTGHSFQYPSDGELTLWWGSDSGSAPTADIWIATTAGTGWTFTVDDGSPTGIPYALTHDLHDNVAGYPWVDADTQAYAADLGTFDGTLPWVSAGSVLPSDHILVTGGKDFWLLEGTLSGPGAFPDGAWVFSMADLGGTTGVFDDGKDAFSPKTTSSVPEPATLLLLGSGLAGLALFGRRKPKKS